jgi:hypothetical protein
MNGIEDRLRNELKEFAQRAQPETIRPLRVPAPRRRARTARWLAPVAAATAVVAVVAGVTLVGRSARNRPATGASAGMPPYYVVLATKASYGRHFTATETANVYDSASGDLLDSVRVPMEPTDETGSISAAANDRLFALTGGSGSESNFGTADRSSIFLLRLAADGHSEGLQRLAVKGAEPGTYLALSPDGSRIAFITQDCPGGCSQGVEVVPLARPSAARIWPLQEGLVGMLSWADDSSQIIVSAPQGVGNGYEAPFRLLNVSGPTGNLLSESRPISLPSAMSDGEGFLMYGEGVFLTSGGQIAVGATQQTNPGRHTVTGKIVELSRGTGRLRVLYVGTEHYTSHEGVPVGKEADYCQVQSLAANGVQPLVLCFQRFGRIVGGRFTPLPGETLPGGPGPSVGTIMAAEAAW